ncbi:MAG: SRPBCC domain-containing protein [Candidatus Hydrothermarchaeota archaeon]
MRIDGEYIVKAPPGKVEELMTSPRAFGECLPGLVDFEERDERHFKARVKPRFSFLRGTLALEFEVLGLERGRMELKILGKGIGSSFEMRTEVRLGKKGSSTALRLTTDAAFGGLLKPVPESLLRGAADELIREILACVERKAGSRADL